MYDTHIQFVWVHIYRCMCMNRGEVPEISTSLDGAPLIELQECSEESGSLGTLSNKDGASSACVDVYACVRVREREREREREIERERKRGTERERATETERKFKMLLCSHICDLRHSFGGCDRQMLASPHTLHALARTPYADVCVF